MNSKYAFVTLLTSKSYVPGAITLAGALKDLHPSPPVLPEDEFETVCLFTSKTINGGDIDLLKAIFDHVTDVELFELEAEKLDPIGEFHYAPAVCDLVVCAAQPVWYSPEPLSSQRGPICSPSCKYFVSLNTLKLSSSMLTSSQLNLFLPSSTSLMS